MAVCLHCGSPRARIVESRTVRLSTGERQNWKTVICPPSPAGCGTRRRQIVLDDGPVGKLWIARVRVRPLRVGDKR